VVLSLKLLSKKKRDDLRVFEYRAQLRIPAAGLSACSETRPRAVTGPRAGLCCRGRATESCPAPPAGPESTHCTGTFRPRTGVKIIVGNLTLGYKGQRRPAHQGSWVGWRKVAHGSAVGRPAAGNEASEALPSLRSAPGYAASGAMIPKLSSLATPQIHSVPPLTGPLAASIGCRRWKGWLGFRSRHPARRKAGSSTQIFAMAAE
jgi:hypothetical protein